MARIALTKRNLAGTKRQAMERQATMEIGRAHV